MVLVRLRRRLKAPEPRSTAPYACTTGLEPEADEQQLHAVRAVCDRAVDTGLLDLTGHDDPYWRSEPVSPAHQRIRSAREVIPRRSKMRRR